jgi:hypothetical protein
VLVFDALDSKRWRARAAGDCRSEQPADRYLVSSPFHDPFSKGNIAYADVFKIGPRTAVPA